MRRLPGANQVDHFGRKFIRGHLWPQIWTTLAANHGHFMPQNDTPETMQAIGRFIQEQRSQVQPFDLVHWGLLQGQAAADQALVRAYEEAGVTWWLENINRGRGSVTQMRAHILKGPPT